MLLSASYNIVLLSPPAVRQSQEKIHLPYFSSPNEITPPRIRDRCFNYTRFSEPAELHISNVHTSQLGPNEFLSNPHHVSLPNGIKTLSPVLTLPIRTKHTRSLVTGLQQRYPSDRGYSPLVTSHHMSSLPTSVIRIRCYNIPAADYPWFLDP